MISCPVLPVRVSWLKEQRDSNYYMTRFCQLFPCFPHTFEGVNELMPSRRSQGESNNHRMKELTAHMNFFSSQVPLTRCPTNRVRDCMLFKFTNTHTHRATERKSRTAVLRKMHTYTFQHASSKCCIVVATA